MRAFRLALYFVVGLLVGCYSAFSFADYPATQKPLISGFILGGNFYESRDAACSAFGGSDYHVGSNGSWTDGCINNTYTNIGYPIYPSQSCGTFGTPVATTGQCVLECPNGGDLDGTVCRENKCLVKKNTSNEGWVETAKGVDPTGPACVDGCNATSAGSLDPNHAPLTTGNRKWTWVTQSFDGTSCTPGAGVTAPVADKTPATTPPVPPKKPPCAPNEGVMTSTSGNVSCVPEGIPDVPKPKVDVQKKVETFPDGTVKETNTTTTTDPSSGAKYVSTGTTTSGKSDGTAGDAGPVGSAGSTTSTSGTGGTGSGDSNGDCTGNDCGAGNPMPEYGELWKKKYPDGLSKVIKDKVDALKQTSLGGLVGKLVPNNLPNAGTCPSYSFNFNMGPKMNFGGQSLTMSCGVWDFIKIVFLITSLLLARRLVFGG